jgi:hypothetical protein
MLKKRFGELVKNIVGEEEFLVLKKKTGFAHAMRTFDQEVKPAFVSDPNRSWFINFPLANLKDDPANDLQANCLHLKW